MKSKYSKANEKLQNAIEQATSLQGTAANQVADAATIDQLTQAVTKAQNLKTVGGCSVLLSETTLRAHARSMSKQISNIKEQTKAVTAAATAVAASKRALEVNKTTAALQKAIADAKTLLDGSAGQVAMSRHVTRLPRRLTLPRNSSMAKALMLRPCRTLRR